MSIVHFFTMIAIIMPTLAALIFQMNLQVLPAFSGFMYFLTGYEAKPISWEFPGNDNSIPAFPGNRISREMGKHNSIYSSQAKTDFFHFKPFQSGHNGLSTFQAISVRPQLTLFIPNRSSRAKTEFLHSSLAKTDFLHSKPFQSG
jgi:hypothetical protein